MSNTAVCVGWNFIAEFSIEFKYECRFKMYTDAERKNSSSRFQVEISSLVE